MGQIQRRSEIKLDADLERLWRTSGRAPIGAAVLTFVAAGMVWGIGKSAAANPTVFDYAAGLIIMAFVAPGLLLLGLEYRGRMLDHARERQIERDEARALPKPRRPLTDKHATLRRKTIRETEDGP